MKKGTTGFHLCASIGALVSATSAHAQEQQPEPVQAGEDSGYRDIVITARRKEELLQDVPVAVTALTGAQLEQAGINRTDDLPRVAPGFIIQASPFGNGALTVTLRSQRQSLPNIVYDPSVAIYFAEVVQTRSQGLNTGLYDLSSVQVLKGPQGTLFGRNSTGGALLISPMGPKRDWGGYAKLTVGNYNLMQAEAAINVPITDSLQARFAGRLVRRDGYVKSLTTRNDLDDENSESWRASLHFEPSDNFTNDLVVNGTHEDSSGSAYKLINVYPNSPAANNSDVAAQLALLRASPFYRTTSNAPNTGTLITTLGISNITKIDLGGFTLKNVAGFRKVDSFLHYDLDGARQDLLYAFEYLNSKQYSDEFQILGNVGDNFDYILGAFYFRETGNDHQTTPSFGVIADTNADAKNISKSVFGQVNYSLPFAPSITLTAGGRYTWDDRFLSNTRTRAGVCVLRDADINGAILNPCRKSVSTSFEKFTYTLSADWKITDDLMVYIAHRKGYRSGGFAISASLPSEFNPYLPEQVTDVEIGAKAAYTMAGGAASTNIALYRQNYRDIQRNLTVFTGTFVQSTIVNAANAVIKGVEIEQKWRPVEAVDLQASLAYSDPKYRSFLVTTSAGMLDYAAAPFAAAPKWIVSGSARIMLGDGDFGKSSIQSNISYRTKTVIADVTSFNPATQTVYPFARLPGFALVDARFEVEKILQGPISLALQVKNLLGKKYYSSGNDIQAIGVSAFLMGAPRTVALEARFQF